MIGILVINRVNIYGGTSNIYNYSKDLIYSKELNEGNMIILNDNDFYHDVTCIGQKIKNKIGYRDIFVFTTIS